MGSGASRVTRPFSKGREIGRGGAEFWTVRRSRVGIGFWTACPLAVARGLRQEGLVRGGGSDHPGRANCASLNEVAAAKLITRFRPACFAA